ncbi:MAG: hypothetical protein HQL53_14105 [Magnetococcales bacterium]|nr:hypothetical protein [Magnetococcales bacterium]
MKPEIVMSVPPPDCMAQHCPEHQASQVRIRSLEHRIKQLEQETIKDLREGIEGLKAEMHEISLKLAKMGVGARIFHLALGALMTGLATLVAMLLAK